MRQLWLSAMAFAMAVLAATGLARADISLPASGQPANMVAPAVETDVGADLVVLSMLSPGDGGLMPRQPVPMPRLAPRTIAYTRDFVGTLPSGGGPDWQCLTEALYFEARGETVMGQFAVAEVILNRVDSPAFPTSVCKVVNQGTGRLFECQFTYRCDGRKETIREPAAWVMAGKIARVMLDGAPRALTDGATHYHTRAVRPRWSRVFALTTTIGMHRFYRMPVRTASKG